MATTPITRVSLLTGFLGSGKTTLLNRLLQGPAMADTAVLINEFGAVSLDHLLVRQASEQIAVLSNGCVCCSVAGDMVNALRDLYFKRANGEVPTFTRVVIETTGLADPAPILHTLIEMPLVAARYALAGVITTIDAEHGDAQLDQHFEAVKQLAVADRVVVTKIDLVAPAALDALIARIRVINPAATILTAVNGAVAADRLFDTGLFRSGEQSPAVQDWLRAEKYQPLRARTNVLRQPDKPQRHDARINAFCLTYLQPLDWQHVIDALEVLIAVRGDHLLRFKAIVNVVGESKPRVLHAVQHTVYPWSALPDWHDADHRSQFVFITRDVDAGFIRDTFDQYLEVAALAA